MQKHFSVVSTNKAKILEIRLFLAILGNLALFKELFPM